MSAIRRVAEPMCGYPPGTPLCDHDIPIAVCDWCNEDERPCGFNGCTNTITAIHPWTMCESCRDDA